MAQLLEKRIIARTGDDCCAVAPIGLNLVVALLFSLVAVMLARDVRCVAADSTEHTEPAVRLASVGLQRIAGDTYREVGLRGPESVITTPRQKIKSSAVLRAKEYIQEHFTKDVSLGQVAKAVDMNMFYFCKRFKKAAGITFTEYLSHLRIENAKLLLLNRDLRVNEIAFAVGFQSLTHFNRVFKKRVGNSPRRYRQIAKPTIEKQPVFQAA